MDLSDFDLTQALKPATKVTTVTVEGIVEPDDLRRLITSKAVVPKSQVGDLKVIREKHHAVARLLAQGMSNQLVATITGYTDVNVRILQNNPAMQELISYYRAGHQNQAEAIGHRLRQVALEAVDVLADRIEDDADSVSEMALLGLAKLGLDRSGHGPSSNHNVRNETHLIDHAELTKLQRAALRESREDIIRPDKTPALPAILPPADDAA